MCSSSIFTIFTHCVALERFMDNFLAQNKKLFKNIEAQQKMKYPYLKKCVETFENF